MNEEFLDVSGELSRILSEELAKNFEREILNKLMVGHKRMQRKIDKKYRKREAKFKKMKRLLDSL